MQIELASGATTLGGRTTRRRLELFVALLFAQTSTESHAVTAAMVRRALAIEPESLRATLRRILREAERQGLRQAIACEHATTGPWWFDPTSGLSVSVTLEGALQSPDAVLRWLLPGTMAAPSAAHVPTVQPVNPKDILRLLDADHEYTQGRLREARLIYFDILSAKLDTVPHAVALMRLAQISRRLEDYESLPNLVRSLSARSDREIDPILRNRLLVATHLSSCWYDYSFRRAYPRVLDRLREVEHQCRAQAESYIEWLTLYGLTQRRLALEIFESEGRERSSFQARVGESIAALEEALALSSFAGNPYQIEQCASNLGNVMGLFAGERYGGPQGSRAQLIRAISHLRTAVVVCDQYALGRDSAYNAAFLLSLVRRHQLSKASSDVWTAAGWPDLIDGVARYGDAEYERIRAGTSGSSVEQMLALAVDICAAALEDADVGLFEKYAREVAELSHELGVRCPPGLRSLAASLRARSRTLGRTGVRWSQAFEEFKHL